MKELTKHQKDYINYYENWIRSAKINIQAIKTQIKCCESLLKGYKEAIGHLSEEDNDQA